MNPFFSMTNWFKNGQELKPKTNERIKLLKQGKLRKLKIEKVANEDIGTYSCETVDDTTSTEVLLTAPKFSLLFWFYHLSCLRISRDFKEIDLFSWYLYTGKTPASYRNRHFSPKQQQSIRYLQGKIFLLILPWRKFR